MTYRKLSLTDSGVKSEGYAFQSQQGFLLVQAPRIAGEAAVRADHAVAWEHDRDRIAVHRAADRARGVRPADPGGEGAVGRHLAERDTRELVQHLLVERR